MADRDGNLVEDRSTAVTRGIGRVTDVMGSFPAITIACASMALWIIGGFFVPGGLGNDVYALALNSATAIATFLMVFVIQNTQNRDSLATQAKLDAQSKVLQLIAKQLDLDDSVDVLTDLIGVEDAPEKVIKADQARVRREPVHPLPD